MITHKLQTRAIEEARRLSENLPEVSVATDYLLEHMLHSDWETLYWINRTVDEYSCDCIEHFNELISWILDDSCASNAKANQSDMTVGDKQKEAEHISKQLTNVSRQISAAFPELCEPYSMLKVVSPWKYATEPYTLGSSKYSRGAEDNPNLDEGETKDTFKELSINSSSQSESSDEYVFTANELFFELKGSWSHVERIVRRKKCYGFEVPVVGKYSILGEIAEYLTKTVNSMGPQEPRRKYPIWCRPAARELWKRISRSPFFAPTSNAQKHRIIEYTIYAYSDYHGLERPGEGWGTQLIEKAVSSRKHKN